MSTTAYCHGESFHFLSALSLQNLATIAPSNFRSLYVSMSFNMLLHLDLCMPHKSFPQTCPFFCRRLNFHGDFNSLLLQPPFCKLDPHGALLCILLYCCPLMHHSHHSSLGPIDHNSIATIPCGNIRYSIALSDVVQSHYTYATPNLLLQFDSTKTFL